MPLGDDSAVASELAEVFKQLDGDGNGKITKSALSAAVEKMGSQLDAQVDQSRVHNATGSGKAGEGPSGGGDGNGTVSSDEEAAYKKLLAGAETKAQA